MTFEGTGHSKREARAAAARTCLAALLARAGRVLPAPNQTQDFTSDEPSKYPVSEFQCLEAKKRPPPSVMINPKAMDDSPVSTPPLLSSPAAVLFGSNNSSVVQKSPINVLYENYPGLSFICTFGDGTNLDVSQAPVQLSHSMRFKVVCLIKDQRFEGYGSSKKLAKLAAARSALAVLEEGRLEPSPEPSHARLPHTLADHIGKMVNEKFNEIMSGDLVHSRRKVLAGIVITTNNGIQDAKVIAVTTGTKCVSGEHMSVRGRVLNDCHAEVAARRCLQRHLYAQLLEYASSADPRVPIPESDIEPVPGGGYQLKPNRQVHLYVSTAPCGDGRIFSPHEKSEPEPDRHPNRLARGQLRTKIESGEGTIPVKNCNNVLQTWDGVMQGERLLTMSCSDKVARWCVVGAQGALLSRLLKPVYLHSLVLGSLLHPHHMYRAICGRIESFIASLPPPFELSRPLLARAASAEARTPARAPSFSVCWCSTSPTPEIVNATTGKLESGQPSMLCKQSMFARWQYLMRRLSPLPQESEPAVSLDLQHDLQHLLYNEAKQLSPAYQAAKERLFEAFEKAKLGSWIKKPLEQDQFVCEIGDADPRALFAWAGPVLLYSSVQDPTCRGQGGRGCLDGENESDGESNFDSTGDIFEDFDGKTSSGNDRDTNNDVKCDFDCENESNATELAEDECKDDLKNKTSKDSCNSLDNKHKDSFKYMHSKFNRLGCNSINVKLVNNKTDTLENTVMSADRFKNEKVQRTNSYNIDSKDINECARVSNVLDKELESKSLISIKYRLYKSKLDYVDNIYKNNKENSDKGKNNTNKDNAQHYKANISPKEVNSDNKNYVCYKKINNQSDSSDASNIDDKFHASKVNTLLSHYRKKSNNINKYSKEKGAESDLDDHNKKILSNRNIKDAYSEFQFNTTNKEKTDIIIDDLSNLTINNSNLKCDKENTKNDSKNEIKSKTNKYVERLILKLEQTNLIEKSESNVDSRDFESDINKNNSKLNKILLNSTIIQSLKQDSQNVNNFNGSVPNSNNSSLNDTNTNNSKLLLKKLIMFKSVRDVH